MWGVRPILRKIGHRILLSQIVGAERSQRLLHLVKSKPLLLLLLLLLHLLVLVVLARLIERHVLANVLSLKVGSWLAVHPEGCNEGNGAVCKFGSSRELCNSLQACPGPKASESPVLSATTIPDHSQIRASTGELQRRCALVPPLQSTVKECWDRRDSLPGTAGGYYGRRLRLRLRLRRGGYQLQSDWQL